MNFIRIGSVVDVQMLWPPPQPLPHNGEVDHMLLALIDYAIREEFPTATVTKSELLPNPVKSVEVVRYFPGTTIPSLKETFDLQATPGGVMVKFPLASHAVRRFADRSNVQISLNRQLDDTTRQRVLMTGIFPGFLPPLHDFLVNYVSNGLGIDNKFMVFFTTDFRELPVFLDELLQSQDRLVRIWDEYFAFPDTFVRERCQRRERALTRGPP